MGNKAFKVGDRVRVIRKGKTCSCYAEFIENNAPKYIGNFQLGYAPNNGDIGVVVGMGSRSENHDPCLAVLSANKVFCIGEVGANLSVSHQSTSQ